MVTARSYAMGMNRYIDRKIDEKNPRTAHRALPLKQLSNRSYLGWCVLFAVGFLLSSMTFGAHIGVLAFFVLIILGLYPFLKRYTFFCHIYLGGCLGLSPVATEVALKGEISLGTIYLALGVLMWVTGFDVIYGIDDKDFDTKEKIYSIPAVLGLKNAVSISRYCFLLSLLFFTLCGFFFKSSFLYYLGVFFVGLILLYEQYLIRDIYNDCSSQKIQFTFFSVNLWVGIVFFLFVVIDYYFSKLLL